MIAIVCQYFYPDSGAGAERSFSYYQFLKNHHRKTVVLTSTETSAKEYPSLILSKKPTLRNIIKDILICKRLISENKIRTAICSIPSVFPVFAFILASKFRRGVRIICDSRDIASLDKSKIKSKIKYLIERFIYINSNLIFATTETQKRIIIRKFGISSKKIKILMNGVDLGRFKFRETPKKYDLIFLGSVALERDPERLYQNLKKFKKEFPRKKIIFVGWDFRYNKNLKKKLEKLGTKIIAQIPQTRAFNYVLKSRIGLVSIKNDPKFSYQLPVKIYEYLAAGLPVIALGGENKNEIKKFMVKYKIGFYLKNSKQFLDACRKLNFNYNKIKANNLRLVQNFDRKKLIARYKEILLAKS